MPPRLLMGNRVIALAALGLSCAATAVEQDWGMWLSNTYQTDFGGSDFMVFMELQPRSNTDASKFSQLIVRPILGYKLSKQASLWAGYAWQGEYDARNKFDMATNDAIEQFIWSDRLTPQMSWQYRARLEQRFFAHEDDVGHRFRQRIRFEYAIADSPVYLVAFDELFVYLNSVNSGRLEKSVQSGINQNRTYLGIGYSVTTDIKIDTGYQLQYVNRYRADDQLNHIWLTNLNVTF